MCSLGLSTSSLVPLPTDVLNVMQVNLQLFPSLRWQYFGTEDGNMYRYPTTVGQTCDNTVFDPRLRFNGVLSSIFLENLVFINSKKVLFMRHSQLYLIK